MSGRASALLSALALVLAVAPGPAQAKRPQAGPGPLSAPERYVLERVAAGAVADLAALGPEGPARTIRARFLEALVTRESPAFQIHRSGLFLVNATVEGPLSLEYADVERPIFISRCRFLGPANFAGSRFEKGLAIAGSSFSSAVNLYRLRVDEDLFLGDTTFSGPVELGGARTGGQLVLRGARFTEAEQGVSLNGVAVGGSLKLVGAAFRGPADFTGIAVSAELDAAGAVFESATAPVSFRLVDVKQGASFSGARFAGPADFGEAAIAGNLLAQGTRFESSEARPSFAGLRVGQHAFFSGATFAAGASLVGAHLKNLMLDGQEGTPLRYPEINLDGAVVDYAFVAGGIDFGRLSASRFEVHGPAILKNVVFSGEVDLRDATFHSFKMIAARWPSAPAAFRIEGFTYQTVSAGEGAEDWRALLAFVETARLDTRNYTQLEAFFQRGGYKERADEVFIHGQRRATLEKGIRAESLLTLVFWDALAGYGRKPTRTFWISSLIILVGMWAFDPRKFDPNFLTAWTWLSRGRGARGVVMRFLISLNQFLPGIDLGLGKLWQLSQASFGLLVYYHLHKLAGWVLIPIGLASIFSRFRAP
jgi:hypothetical protein